jgi:hypothetical protein
MKHPELRFQCFHPNVITRRLSLESVIDCILFIKKGPILVSCPMAHVCNPSYLRGRDGKIIVLSQPGQKVMKALSQRTTSA